MRFKHQTPLIKKLLGTCLTTLVGGRRKLLSFRKLEML